MNFIMIGLKTNDMKDLKGNEIKIGDTIDIVGLQTEVEGFVNFAGQPMVKTKYGDFNPTLVKIIASKEAFDEAQEGSQ